MSQLQQYLWETYRSIAGVFPGLNTNSDWRQTTLWTTLRVCAKMIGLVCGAFLITVLVFGLVTTVGRLTGVLPESSEHPKVILVQLVVQAVAFALTTGAYVYSLDVSPSTALRVSRPTVRESVLAVAAGCGLLATLVGITALATALPGVEQPAEHSLATAVNSHPELLLWLLVLGPVLLAPAEELLFRGIVQTRLKGSLNGRGAIIVATLIFALLHIPSFQGPGAVPSFLFICVSGGLFGWLLENTDTIATPIIAHSIYNVLIFWATYMNL